ncbi:hypothetical protein B0H67DRAFT_472276, partial [Lasiosphaeris hirsuta]
PACHPPPPRTTLSTATAVTISDSAIPDSCTTKVTQTFYSTSGCELACSSGFCVIDAAVTVPCGCSRVAIQTTTITACPTKTPCYQCYTGWGTFFETASCEATAVPAFATPT